MFITGLANLVYIGPETTRVMRLRKHQGMSGDLLVAVRTGRGCEYELTECFHTETRDGKKAYDAAPHSEAMQKLNTQFSILHSISSVTNLIGLGAMIWYAGSLVEIL